MGGGQCALIYPLNRVTRIGSPNGEIICLIFGNLRQLKVAQYLQKLVKAGTKFPQILKTFEIYVAKDF